MSIREFRNAYYKLLTKQKAAATIRQLNKDIESKKDIIVVHQMGRAASMTVTSTIRSMNLAIPVYHTHWLNKATVKDRMGRINARTGPLNVRVANTLSPVLYNDPKGRNWHFISIIRDPVARNLSAYFLSIEYFIKDFFYKYNQGHINLENLLDIFLNEFPHEQPLTWFDEEVKDPIGLDIFDIPFDNERGFVAVKIDNVSFLVIKLEKLNSVYEEALKIMFGKKPEKLINTHVTEENADFGMYKEFLEKIVIPEDYLDEMYDSRYARHFYSNTEIAKFKKKWLHDN